MDDNGMIYRKSLDNYGIYVRKNGKKRGKLPDVYVGVFICIAPEEVAEDDNFLPYFAIACRPRSYGDYPIYDEEFHKISNENYRIEQKYEENKYKDNLYYRWYDSNETHFQNEIQTWNSITYIHPLIEINSENDIKDLIDKALWMSQQVINIYPT